MNKEIFIFQIKIFSQSCVSLQFFSETFISVDRAPLDQP